jgi:putative PEP-CTERM system integral membrane protein
MKTFVHALCSAIFWLWNSAFLLVVFAGMLPFVGVSLWQAAIAGEIPASFLLSFLGVMVTPLVCTGIGWRLRKHPVLLMRLFYGVEAPLFALCLLRLFVIRELTAASTHILGSLAVCMATLAIELLSSYTARRHALGWLRLFGHSLMLVMGVYGGVLLLFYTVPAFATFLYAFLSFDWVRELWWMLNSDSLSTLWWGTIALLLFGFSCTLFVAMPYALVNLYTRSWWRAFSTFGAHYGWVKAGLSTAGVTLTWIFLFFGLQNQPQLHAFSLLQSPPTTVQARQELLQRSDLIRRGLVNSYLHAYRYLSPWEESNQLREMYKSLFNMGEDHAQQWQNFHNAWISPFLYRGDRADLEKAAALYAQFFDAPIQRVEADAIRHALQSTVQRDQVQAGLLNINQEIVWLAQQRVNVQEHGDWAEVELYEHYQNPTDQDQEIFYSFSLPESAVITGVWLGNQRDRDQRFRFMVSPRGAAQKVYNEEVDRANFTIATDPALVEQVGPRQYRLRVFPIPARSWRTQKPGELHLWLTYRVMQHDRQWALPQLTEKRNIFWTNDTVRRRQGRPTSMSVDLWLESSLPAKQSPATTHQVTLANYQVEAKPIATIKRHSANQRLALVLDTSYSMGNHQAELTQTLNRLQQNSTIQPDLYVSVDGAGASLTDLRSFDVTKTPCYGSLIIPTMMQQFEQVRGEKEYDAIVVLTDQGSYELSRDTVAMPNLTPLWIVHLGGSLPPAYDDATLQTLQRTRGGSVTSLEAVLQQLDATTNAAPSAVSVADGYAWTVTPATTPTSTTTKPEVDFTPIAARQLILNLSRTEDMTQLTALDTVHAIAKSSEIVTPYSSMLVLVDERQREALRQAEAGDDRFQRTVEKGEEDLTQPDNPLNSVAVPEPGLGLGLAVVALLMAAKRTRLRKSL